MVLLNDSKSLTYLAQTGVIGAPSGQSYPTHLTPFTLVSTDPTMTGDQLDIVFEAQSVNVTVVKTYNLHKGRYDLSDKNSISNLVPHPISPSIFLHILPLYRTPPHPSP